MAEIKSRFHHIDTHEWYLTELWYEDVKAEPLEPYQGIDTKIEHRWTACGHTATMMPIDVLTGKEDCPTCRRATSRMKRYLKKLENEGIQVEVLGEYVNNHTKIKHLWKECGHVTEIRPKHVLSGIRCTKCPKVSASRRTHEEYVGLLQEKGLDTVVVPLENYVKGAIKILHRWLECGHTAKMAPTKVLIGYGCPTCQKEKMIQRCVAISEAARMRSASELDKQVGKIHGTKVRRDPDTPYVNALTKISWVCDQGHRWEATPASIKSGIGCPECARRKYKGEVLTKEVLEEYGIDFQTQKKFADLYHKRESSPLSYDFYIPSMDILIECQGEQHYKPSTYFHGENAEEAFADQQERDQLKREYAWENGYYLLEISYKDYRKDRIKAILEDAGVLQKQPA